eukprot:jgi/Astpho2/6303/Aster-08353
MEPPTWAGGSGDNSTRKLALQIFEELRKACGSGGTTAGLALGLHLNGSKARLHSFGVCDDSDYF